MAKEEDDRHKSKKHKRDRDRDRGEHKDQERDKKRSRSDKDKPPRTESPPKHASPNGNAAGERDPPMKESVRQVRSNDEGAGEISMSIEETNKMRLSLGLKPLQVESSADKERAAHTAAVAVKAAEAKKIEEATMAEHIKERREHRKEQEKLKNIKTLGEAGEDVDDLAAWVVRNKKAEKKARDLEKQKAAKLAKQFEEQDEDESDEEQLANGTELAGMKVKHDANELNEGETMILTLTDRQILDDKGLIDDDAEELENVLVTEDKLRRKAFKAGTKENKPLFGEDGRVQGLLEKYDPEAEDEGMVIDDQGAIEEAKRKRQDDIRAKLRAAESAATGGGPSFESKGDYYTAEEMAQFSKPKSQKKRKIRKKAAEPVEETLDIAALEAEAAAAEGGNDRGSRADKQSRDAKKAEAREAQLQERKDRYDNALKKANIASLALQQTPDEEDEEDADDDLQASLERARRAARQKAEASQKGDEDVAAEAARRRQQQREREQEEGGLEFSEAKDFANSIQMIEVKEEEPEGKQDTEMHEEEPQAAPTPPPKPLPPPPPLVAQPSFGGWVPADKVKEETEEEMPDARVEVKEEKPDSLARERAVGSGLAGVMGLLRDRGELQQGPEWAGRTNDMKGDKLQGLDDIYSGGNHIDRMSASIEQALTQRDEFGRIMTPKERFRDLCHNFHGKTISKGKQEKRIRKLAEEMEAKRAATGEGSSSSFSRIGGQHMAGTPYVVLSGNLQPGQSSDPASGFSTVDRRVAPTPVLGGAMPVLGGGDTPLVGARKVEMMLGLKKEPGGAVKADMPPPAPRNLRKGH